MDPKSFLADADPDSAFSRSGCSHVDLFEFSLLDLDPDQGRKMNADQ